jgi:hypothetical protein
MSLNLNEVKKVMKADELLENFKKCQDAKMKVRAEKLKESTGMAGSIFGGIMKDTTMQELGMENETHLYNSCHEEISECSPSFVIYGTGKGNDNIAACDTYNPVHVRNYEEERDIVLKK